VYRVRESGPVLVAMKRLVFHEISLMVVIKKRLRFVRAAVWRCSAYRALLVYRPGVQPENGIHHFAADAASMLRFEHAAGARAVCGAVGSGLGGAPLSAAQGAA
jgi:hypothetical protein